MKSSNSPRVYLRVGNDHLVVGRAYFNRVSDDGKLLARAEVPKSKTSFPYGWIGSMAPWPGGALALYGDNVESRLGKISLDGVLGGNSSVIKLFKMSDGGSGILAKMAGKLGFLYSSNRGKRGDYSYELKFMNISSAGILEGTPKSIAKHCVHWYRVEGAHVSYLLCSQPKEMKVATLDLSVTGAKPQVVTIPGPRASDQPSPGLWVSRAPSGEMWVGLSEATSKGDVLRYTVVKDGKPLLATPRDLTPPLSGHTDFSAVANDGKRFVVLWAVARHKWNEQPKVVYRAQVFDMKGNPLTPAHDAGLKSTVVWVVQGVEGTQGILRWTGKDFVFFYIRQWLYDAELRMARLELRE